MRKLSIKMKVTLWYTGLIVIIMALVLGIILASSDKILLLNIGDQLEESVKEGFRDIDYKNGRLEIDHDFEYFDDGVTLLIYDHNGVYWKAISQLDLKQTCRSVRLDFKRLIIMDRSG